jgi:UDPglucose 6-dehydrogenase
MNITVYGLWHLGCVTAACLAAAGEQVVGLDPDGALVAGLNEGRPPLFEPGLAELIADSRDAGRLVFTTDAAQALREADVLWVTFDTPVNERDEADVVFVRERLEAVAPALRPGTLVLVSSQVPVGFTGALARNWYGRDLTFAYSPENLRLGKAIEVFRQPERVVIGTRGEAGRETLRALFAPFCDNLVWMTVESAEMTKHAVNAFLATSVTFANELARLCEALGADAREVERGLKSEGRIGPKAYLSPGAAFAGGTLARDLRFLAGFGRAHQVATPLFDGVLQSNETHKGWLRERVSGLLEGVAAPVVALLGLTYKPGTSTLRRSTAVELCEWLVGQGVRVRAFDPAVPALPAELAAVELAADARAALAGADLAVIATEWPEFRALAAEDFLAMRRPAVIDQNWFLAGALAGDRRIAYTATGRTARNE